MIYSITFDFAPADIKLLLHYVSNSSGLVTESKINTYTIQDADTIDTLALIAHLPGIPLSRTTVESLTEHSRTVWITASFTPPAIYEMVRTVVTKFGKLKSLSASGTVFTAEIEDARLSVEAVQRQLRMQHRGLDINVRKSTC